MPITRRHFLRAAATVSASALCLGAYDGWFVEPKWVETTFNTISIPNLPESFENLKIAHISDLHLDKVTSLELLLGWAEIINAQNPDIIVVTGDFATAQTSRKYIEDVKAFLASLKAKLGVFGVPGNHDYFIYRKIGHLIENRKNTQPTPQPISEIPENQAIILKNAYFPLNIGNDTLYLVGLGEYIGKDAHPDLAFANIPEDATKIAIFHNPDCTELLGEHKPDLMLCGHTHGGQVRLPFIGPILLPVKNRKLDQGLKQYNNIPIYINRGLGVLPRLASRVRLLCRPEISIHTLKRK